MNSPGGKPPGICENKSHRFQYPRNLSSRSLSNKRQVNILNNALAFSERVMVRLGAVANGDLVRTLIFR